MDYMDKKTQDDSLDCEHRPSQRLLTMLPPTIPLFPLPNVVLFPNVSLPLHIFEPRYRDMVADALDGDRIIGMVLLRPGWEADYEGRPPIYPVGCAGLITHAERLPDGRYNIVLQRAREIPDPATRTTQRAYRIARSRRRSSRADDERRPRRRCARSGGGSKRCSCRSRQDAASIRRCRRRWPDEDLVNALAQYLELEPVEKQALLERDGLLARCRSLIELLEMKVIVSRHEWGRGGISSRFGVRGSGFGVRDSGFGVRGSSSAFRRSSA